MACAERRRLNHTPAEVSESIMPNFCPPQRDGPCCGGLLQMLDEDSPKAVLSVDGMHVSAAVWQGGSVTVRKHTWMLITRP